MGVDIGGTKTDAVVLAENGAVAHRLRLPTGFGAAAVIGTAWAAVLRLGEAAGIEPRRFTSIGIGIPGAVDATSGRVSHAVNLGLEHLELGAELASRLGRPVRIENDVNAAAVGAFAVLGLPQTSSMAYLNLGTGLAAGLMVRGELWRGSRGTAGEIGHIPVDPAGEVCRCGQRGCLETIASGTAVGRLWRTSDPHPAASLLAAAAAGDPAATRAAALLGKNIASAVRLLTLTVDAETVVIGGGLSALGPELIFSVREALGRTAASSPFLASLHLADRVQLVPQTVPVAAVGAALIG